MCKLCDNSGWELAFINDDWEYEFCRCGIEPKAGA